MYLLSIKYVIGWIWCSQLFDLLEQWIILWRHAYLQVSPSSLTIPVSGSITTEQVIKEALCRFRLENENVGTYQLVKVNLDAGRGKRRVIRYSRSCCSLSHVEVIPVGVIPPSLNMDWSNFYFLFFQSLKLFWPTMTFHGKFWNVVATSPFVWWNWPGKIFTNILRAALLYESGLSSFSLLTVWVRNFCGQRKSAQKGKGDYRRLAVRRL